MTKVLYIVCILALAALRQDCEPLSDGIYLVRQTAPKGKKDYQLLLRSGDYILVTDTSSHKGKVIKNIDCSLILDIWKEDKAEETEDQSLPSNDKFIMIMGKPMMEFGRQSADTTFFRMTWTGNRRITTARGYLLRNPN